MVEAPPVGPMLPPLPYSILSCPVSCFSLVHLMPVGTVFPYSLPPSYYLSVTDLWLTIVLPCPSGMFMQRRLPECCPRTAWLGQQSTFCHFFYRASVSLLEPALHTINIKCNGDFPGAAQERLGSLNDHSFIVLCTAPL